MSERVLRWALRQRVSSTETRLALMLLACLADDEGYLARGVSALDDLPAARVLSKKQIRAAISDLEFAGLIEVVWPSHVGGLPRWPIWLLIGVAPGADEAAR